MIAARFLISQSDFTLDVDLQIPPTGVTAIFGHSGSGKTTLLRAIAGLEQHSNGHLTIAETVWQDNTQFVPPHQRAIGYVFQEASLFNHLSVENNILYGYKRIPDNQHKLSLDHIIELLGIRHLLQRKPHSLSGGERQRVAIARALATSPQLLLMDEPLASLDIKLKQEILPYIESLHRNLEIPVLYVSHSPEEVARLADHMLLMEHGRVIAQGDVHELFTRLDLPLAHGDNATTIIEATVTGHDETYHLTDLAFSGGHFSVTRQNLTVGDNVRLKVIARDISLTLAHQSDTSILNIFPATVTEITTEGDAQVTVKLAVGEIAMLARITRKSAALLSLQPGSQVYAQVKSIALLT